MSRPKTGSVTAAAPAGANGTWWAHSRMVSHAAASEPPMVSASSPETMTSPTPAIGVRSGRSSASKTMVRGSPKPGGPGRRRPPALELAASLTRSMMPRRLDGPLPGGGLSRFAIARLPSRTTSARARPPMNSSAWAPTRVQKTPSKWTLAYHRASVHRSMPKLNSRKSAISAARMTHRPMRRPRPERAPSSGPPGARRRRMCSGGGRSASSVDASSSPCLLVGRSSSSRSSSSVSGVVGVALVRRLRGGVRLAARLCFAAAQLLEEVVEHVTHRPRSLVGIGVRAGAGPRSTCGTPRGRSPRARSGASPRRGPARTGRPRG